jgi:hypothetical protein
MAERAEGGGLVLSMEKQPNRAFCRCNGTSLPRDERIALREALEELLEWCDDRRDAPTLTTLGMVQERIRDIITSRCGT